MRHRSLATTEVKTLLYNTMTSQDFSQFIGNAKIRDRFRGLADAGELAHAYLFSGPKRLGKYTLAEMVARRIVVDPRADIVRIAPERDAEGAKKDRDIDVDTIRQARRRLSMGSEASMRACIIDDAHRMTDAAQNALLKILEEPRGKTVFFLVTSVPGELLATILSRCERAAFSLVAQEELAAAISREDALQLARLSFGRPGTLVRLLEHSEEAKRRETLMKFFETFSRRTAFERLQLAERIAKKPASARDFLEDWTEFERNRARSERGAVRPAYRRIEKLLDTSETLENTNANTRLLFEAMMVGL